MPVPISTPRGPLRPAELAAGAVLGGVTAALSVVAALIPIAGALQLVAAVPMGILAQRHRPRALISATVAAGLIAFLVAGTGAAIGVCGCAFLGGVAGDVKRRGRGSLAAFGYAAVSAPLLALAVDGLLLVFGRSRDLLLESAAHTARGVATVMAPGVTAVDDVLALALRYWWVWIGVSVVATVLVGMWFSWLVLGAVLDRLAWLPVADHLQPEADAHPPAPLPVTLRGVGFRYPNTTEDVLTGVDLVIDSGEFVAVVGANGSGKSTLIRILAGREPSSGTVERPGAPGLGRPGGTAMVLQHPETQILGVTVADDVVWGLPPGTNVDVEALLARVGLAGLGARSTDTLSGGQLQRLAVAAALARRPALLIADEATAMIDPDGRRELLALLAGLPKSEDMAVVLVTHHEGEATAADRVIHLENGTVVDPALGPRSGSVTAGPITAGPITALLAPVRQQPILQLMEVGHVYAEGTPWRNTALRDVTLTIREGEGVLITGGNGSGKSTLAWIIAGLQRPDRGACLLDGRPTTEQVGAVALAFQHARLQLQRRTVGSDIAAAAGFSPTDRDRVAAALDRVGLEPRLARRSIDQLSGGQMRRVVLAGLLAGNPRMLVLDEPLAGLDARSREELVALLATLRRSAGLTVVVISHDLEDLDAACPRRVMLADGVLTEAVLTAGGVR